MNWKKFKKDYLITAIISIVLGLIFFFLFYKKNRSSLIGAVDGAAISSVLLISISFFIYASRQGFFDFASYGFKQFGSILFAKKAHAYNDFPGYKEVQSEKRKTQSKYYIIVFLIGLLFLIATIVLEIIYKSSL